MRMHIPSVRIKQIKNLSGSIGKKYIDCGVKLFEENDKN